jgi:threonine/homoserine/homoserine lactone efflux protein
MIAEITLFLKGLIIGFAMALPIGPIGIICVRKTLTEGKMHGFVIGLGAATADMLYACIAAFGLTMISDLILEQQFWIQLIGGSLLLYIGVKTYLTLPKDPTIPADKDSLAGSFFYTVFLTLTNPLTIFSFLAVFAAFGFGDGMSLLSATTLVVGVFVGSALWFLVLTMGVTLFRKKLDMRGLKWVNRIAGLLIIITGVVALVTLVNFL